MAWIIENYYNLQICKIFIFKNLLLFLEFCKGTNSVVSNLIYMQMLAKQ